MTVKELLDIIEDFSDNPVFIKCTNKLDRTSIRFTAQEIGESDTTGTCYIHAYVKGKGLTTDDLYLILRKFDGDKKIKGLLSDSSLRLSGNIVDVYEDNDDTIIEIECSNPDTLELISDKIDF